MKRLLPVLLLLLCQSALALTRTPVVLNYAFTAADGTNVSILNGGADWAEQDLVNGAIRVITNLYDSPFSSFSDVAWKGAGVGTVTANQYFEVTLTWAGLTNQNDNIGGDLLDSGGGFNAFSAYRIYLDDAATQSVQIDRIVNGTVTNIGSVISNGTTLPTWVTGNKLSCEVQIVAGSPVFQIYRDSGSGPVAYGSTITDSSVGKLTTGVFGVTGNQSGNTLRGGPFTGGNLTSGTPATPTLLLRNDHVAARAGSG